MPIVRMSNFLHDRDSLTLNRHVGIERDQQIAVRELFPHTRPLPYVHRGDALKNFSAQALDRFNLHKLKIELTSKHTRIETIQRADSGALSQEHRLLFNTLHVLAGRFPGVLLLLDVLLIIPYTFSMRVLLVT